MLMGPHTKQQKTWRPRIEKLAAEVQAVLNDLTEPAARTGLVKCGPMLAALRSHLEGARSCAEFLDRAPVEW